MNRVSGAVLIRLCRRGSWQHLKVIIRGRKVMRMREVVGEVEIKLRTAPLQSEPLTS